MKYFSLLVSFSLIVTACTNSNEDLTNNNPKIIDSTALNQIRNDSIEKAERLISLKNINEPNLEIQDREAYRFMLWRAFHPNAVLFRVEKTSDNDITMTTKYFRFSYPEDQSKDTIYQEYQKKLTLDDWNAIVEKTNSSYFWTLETHDNPKRNILDGSSWTIEGKRFPDPHFKGEIFKEYTKVSRRSPYKGSFYELGETIMKLSGLEKEKELY